MTAPVPEPNAEDAKLLQLARAATARTRAPAAAAVRDADGRTYVATTVALPHLRLSALATAVAMAVSSGVRRLTAAVVVTDDDALDAHDLAVLGDLAGPGCAVWRADPSGAVREHRLIGA